AADRYIGSRLPPDVVSVVDSKPSGTLRTTLFEGGALYAAWHTVPLAGWGVGAGIPVAPLDWAIYEAVATAAAGAVLCLALGLYLASLVARHVVRPLDQLSRGATQVTAPVVVREVADLQRALSTAQERDVIVRRRLQATADEFETLFNSSPVALAFAHDPHCQVVTSNSAMEALL